MAVTVHVWSSDLDAPAVAADVLSPDEQERASSRVGADGVRRFVASRVFLRETLSRYVGIAPEELRFDAGPHGKPALRGSADVRFSLSHSGPVALLAVAFGVEVGIDVERHRVVPDAVSIARRFFTREEADRVAADPACFLDLWVAKEAVVKALGDGFHRDLDTFHVEPTTRVNGLELSVVSLDVAGAAAALAVVGSLEGVERFSYPSATMPARR